MKLPFLGELPSCDSITLLVLRISFASRAASLLSPTPALTAAALGLGQTAAPPKQ